VKTKLQKRCFTISIFILIGIAGIILLVTSGCGGGGGNTIDVKVFRDGIWLTTPNGYHASIPPSVYTHGLWLKDRVVTNPQEIDYLLSSWIDTRAKQFSLQYGLVPPKSIDIVLVDHHTFYCGFASYNNLCEGMWDRKTTIYESIYEHFKGYSFPDYSAPWTRLTVQEMEAWSGTPRQLPFTHHAGVIEDIGLTSMIHEWGHPLGLW